MRLNADGRERGHVIGWGERPAGELAALAEVLVATKKEQVWQELALCAETDPESFFPEKGGSTKDAKQVCLRCEVKDQCLEYALAREERFGIWGGLSERERRKLKDRSADRAVMRAYQPMRAQRLPPAVVERVKKLLESGLRTVDVMSATGVSRKTVVRYAEQLRLNASTNGTAA